MSELYVVFMSLYDENDYDVSEEYYVVGVFSDLEKAEQASKDVVKEYEDYNEYDDSWSVDSWIKEVTIDSYNPGLIYRTYIEEIEMKVLKGIGKVLKTRYISETRRK